MPRTRLSQITAIALEILRYAYGINLRLINECRTTVSPRYFSADSGLAGGLVLGPHSYTNLSLAVEAGTLWAVCGAVWAVWQYLWCVGSILRFATGLLRQWLRSIG